MSQSDGRVGPPAAASMAESWAEMVAVAQAWTAGEPALAPWLDAVLLRHRGFPEALAYRIAELLASDAMPVGTLAPLFALAMEEAPEIAGLALRDLQAHCGRDPACRDPATPLLYRKGFHAICAHRFAHWFWSRRRRPMALWMQGRSSEVFGVDIHPAARLGGGLFLDHATGVVIGETAVVGEDVSMLHQVTLGGTGKQSGDRHPKIGAGVLLSAGAKVLGNVRVGDGAKVGAGSVVLEDVPANTTVVGVPARVVGHPGTPMPSLQMDHSLPVEPAAEAGPVGGLHLRPFRTPSGGR